MNTPLSVVILAAGQGTRMRSAQPKVLHPLAGKPLLSHVIDTARKLGAEGIYVVYGHGGAQVRSALATQPVCWVEQTPQLGTGHAVAQALPEIPDHHTLLVLYGDVPLASAETLLPLLDAKAQTGFGLLTVILENPKGYGRIVRTADGAVQKIVEEKDASVEIQTIQEVNTGILCAGAAQLKTWLGQLDNDNAQQEYYLTDVVAMAVQDKLSVHTVVANAAWQVMGVNDRIQLAALERIVQRQQADALMRQGASLIDPSRFDQRGEVTVGQDVQIDVGVILEGQVRLADKVQIGAYCQIRDSELGEGVEILPHCVIEGARIAAGVRVGPFARLRPGTELAMDARIGNFVEIKQSQIGEGSKVSHLSYIGDSTLGRKVNIGAGTITCNYDGVNKHPTLIEDEVFIGSNSQLVAPVCIGRGATIGAGSTINRDAPPDKLTLTRAVQRTIKGWQRPVKKTKDSSKELGKK